MPYRDGTGPQGQGPRTGRGQGNCAGQGGAGWGRGFGRRRNVGRGWGSGFGWWHRFFGAGPAGWDYPRYAPSTQEENLQTLKAEADWLQGQLDAVNKRIEDLEK